MFTFFFKYFETYTVVCLLFFLSTVEIRPKQINEITMVDMFYLFIFFLFFESLSFHL